MRFLSYNIFLLCLVFLLFPQHSFSQTDEEDASGLWTTFSVEKPLSKKVSLNFDEELRLRDFCTDLNLVYTNLGVSYKPVKRLKIDLTYRWTEKYVDYEKADGWFSTRHRLMFNVSYKYKINNIILAYRTMIQSEFKNYNSSSKGKVPEWFWRNKFEVKYEIKKFTPYIGTEVRYQIKDPRNPYADMGFHRIRMFAGCDYKINKRNSVGAYFLAQREFGVVHPEGQYVLGLQYEIVLN
jgi:hypothetical protein